MALGVKDSINRKESQMETLWVMQQLRTLRCEIEQETGGLTQDQVCLLNDVCQALEFHGMEVTYIIGDAIRFVDLPVKLMGEIKYDSLVL